MKYYFVRWTFFSFNIFVKKGKSNVRVYKNRNIFVATGRKNLLFVPFLPAASNVFVCICVRVCKVSVCFFVKKLADKVLLKRPSLWTVHIRRTLIRDAR